jgi:ATP-binding cassette subfamily F protein 3
MAAPLNLLQLTQGEKTFGGQHIFQKASFAVNEGEHLGVIGPNGAGKTTLFRILIGEEDLDSGQMIKSQTLKLGYLSQHDHWGETETGNQFLERVCQMPTWQVKSSGRDLRVSEAMLDRPILSLSGGYLMRIKLLGLLGQKPTLMLLDEPTNYLDLETTLLLERFLQNFDGAFMLISHDREFLRRTTDHILEVEQGEMTKFNGNIDDYFEQKELLRSQMAAAAATQAEKRKQVLDFVARFGAKATKAKQAQSRLKSLEKMETIELKAIPVSARILIPAPIQVGKIVQKISHVSLGYGSESGSGTGSGKSSKSILTDINLEIWRGDHLAVVGFNGAGKSTLLKGLAGTLLPQQGQRELGLNVKLAIFNQHVIEVLNPEDTVLSSLQAGAHPEVSRQEILAMAGSLLFSGDRIQKKINVLSGGEKSRVALGRVLLQRAPFLLLDEPTNHLDFQTVEALTQALEKYPGTLVVVSHDRGFIRRVGTKIVEVDQGKVFVYPGTYDEYVWSLQQRLSKEESSEGESEFSSVGNMKENTQGAREKQSSRDQKKEKERLLKTLTKKLNLCEGELARLETENLELNNLIAASPQGGRQDGVMKMAENSSRIAELETLWLSLSEEISSHSEG